MEDETAPLIMEDVSSKVTAPLLVPQPGLLTTKLLPPLFDKMVMPPLPTESPPKIAGEDEAYIVPAVEPTRLFDAERLPAVASAAVINVTAPLVMLQLGLRITQSPLARF